MGCHYQKKGNANMKWTRTRAAGALAVGTASALVLSACGEDAAATPNVTHDPVTITVNYWGNFGFTEEATGPSLESVYEDTHDWVSLEMVTGEYGAQHDALTQALIAGSGAANVAAIDEGYITGFVAQADGFVNLLDLGAGQYKDAYLPWKWDQAANADGSVVIGLGSDVGGMALCYRKDLFDAAGLDSDRDAVSAAVGDSWDDFIAVGQDYVAGSGGKKFVDNATNILNPALSQLGLSYYDRNNELDMEAIKPAFDTAIAVIDAGLSAGIGAWSPEWNAGFANGDFAVLACPAWMLGYIMGQISAETFAGQWDIADIPGDGGNWGGSFYTVPKQGSETTQQESYDFIEWVIQPAQQLKIMKETGNLPSQIAILESADVAEFTNEFFNNAPYGTIFAKTVLDIPSAIYYAPNNGAIRTAVETVLNDVQAGTSPIADAWTNAVAAATAADA
jgi:cellobiose transport system substrate-binding protein